MVFSNERRNAKTKVLACENLQVADFLLHFHMLLNPTFHRRHIAKTKVLATGVLIQSSNGNN
jgi:hypothetical protein